jgi:AraC family transcriptional regulator
MTPEALYGDRLAKLFPILDSPDRLVVKSIRHGAFAATRMSYDGVCDERTHPNAPEDAFALCSRLKNQKARIWLDGRTGDKSGVKGETTVYDLRSEILLHFEDPVDILYMYVPRRALIETAEQEGTAGVDFSVEAGKSIVDPVMAHLGRCLLPADRVSEPGQRLVRRTSGHGDREPVPRPLCHQVTAAATFSKRPHGAPASNCETGPL